MNHYSGSDASPKPHIIIHNMGPRIIPDSRKHWNTRQNRIHNLIKFFFEHDWTYFWDPCFLMPLLWDCPLELWPTLDALHWWCNECWELITGVKWLAGGYWVRCRMREKEIRRLVTLLNEVTRSIRLYVRIKIIV